MSTNYSRLETIEYRHRFGQGLLEVFIGAAVTMIGVSWLTDNVALGAVAPALAVPLWQPAYERFVEPRLGFVRPTPQRRRRERGAFVRLVVLGFVFLALGVGAFLVTDSDGTFDALDTVVPAMPVFLLAIGAAGAGTWLGLTRLMAVAALFAASGACVVALEWHPGTGMLAPGVVVLLAGIALFTAFRHRTRPA